MALNWDITKADRLPREEPTEDAPLGVVTDEFWPTLNAAIWGLLGVGMHSITDANAATFYARYSVLAALSGFDPISPEDVYKMVGLSANVTPETDAGWRKRVFDWEVSDRARRYERAVAKLNAASGPEEEGE